VRYSAIWPSFAQWWDRMTINAGRRAEFTSLARLALEHKERYQAVETLTGVPWAMIAVIHRREGDANFDTYLGNGQSLSRVTTIVPKGRGPFRGSSAFIDGAVDALKVDLLVDVKDWRLEKQLFQCEGFNGWGYGSRPSPYVWGGTNIQIRGKYIRDHVFDPDVWDTQPGCAPLLASIAQLDSSVHFVRESAGESVA
jgi:lysozyme family protein